MLFAEAPANSLYLVPLIFGLTVAFLLGDLVGLLPFFLARSKNRPGMAALALLSCGVAGAVFLPVALLVAVVYSAAALAMGRYDPARELERQAAAVARREMHDAVRVGLTSERFLPR